jgi:phosphonate transport system substrate-binding protein
LTLIALRRLLVLLVVALLAPVPAKLHAETASIRIGVTPVILHDDYGAMLAFGRYIEKRTGWTVEMVPRNSYRQTMDMIKRGDLDFAWVSAFPYVYLSHRNQARMVAMPVMNGSPTFRAYLIVSVEDRDSKSIRDLQGKTFAYADVNSHTGYVVPRFELQGIGLDASTFFSRTFFVDGHKNVVRAVASGLADAGSVDSFVWEALSRTSPQLTAQTRVVSKSAEFGSPPIVAARHARNQDVERLRTVLVTMDKDESGAAVLKRLHIDGFVRGDPKAFSEAKAMMRAMGDL